MKDASLIDDALSRIPDEWRRKYLARSVESLPKDVTAAFDRIYKLEREKDQFRAEVAKAMSRGEIWLFVLTLLSLGELAGLVVLISLKTW